MKIIDSLYKQAPNLWMNSFLQDPHLNAMLLEVETRCLSCCKGVVLGMVLGMLPSTIVDELWGFFCCFVSFCCCCFYDFLSPVVSVDSWLWTVDSGKWRINETKWTTYILWLARIKKSINEEWIIYKSTNLGHSE